MTHDFQFGGETFEVAGEAALYWRAQDALLVSDLHLEKASAFALYGQMLPPYDSVSTLQDIAALCSKYSPAKIISLGDNFHDDDGECRLAEDAAALLVDLTGKTEWIWITGNHDRAVSGIWGGEVTDSSTSAFRLQSCQAVSAPSFNRRWARRARRLPVVASNA